MQSCYVNYLFYYFIITCAGMYKCVILRYASATRYEMTADVKLWSNRTPLDMNVSSGKTTNPACNHCKYSITP